MLPVSLLAAVTLLTRFGRSDAVDAALAARAVRWYGAVGLWIGLLTTVPILLWVQSIAPSAIAGPWLPGWAYVLLVLWVSRAVHADGLADVADALGSGASGDRFWHIMRDSRIGAFGVVALLMALAGLIIAAALRVEAETWSVLILAPVFGRSCAVLLAFATKPHDVHSLGGQVCAGATVPIATLCALQALACVYFLPLRDMGATLTLSAVCLIVLRRIALRHGGMNGDMLGTAIICTELLFLIPF